MERAGRLYSRCRIESLEYLILLQREGRKCSVCRCGKVKDLFGLIYKTKV